MTNTTESPQVSLEQQSQNLQKQQQEIAAKESVLQQEQAKLEQIRKQYTPDIAPTLGGQRIVNPVYEKQYLEQVGKTQEAYKGSVQTAVSSLSTTPTSQSDIDYAKELYDKKYISKTDYDSYAGTARQNIKVSKLSNTPTSQSDIDYAKELYDKGYITKESLDSYEKTAYRNIGSQNIASGNVRSYRDIRQNLESEKRNLAYQYKLEAKNPGRYKDNIAYALDSTAKYQALWDEGVRLYGDPIRASDIQKERLDYQHNLEQSRLKAGMLESPTARWGSVADYSSAFKGEFGVAPIPSQQAHVLTPQSEEQLVQKAKMLSSPTAQFGSIDFASAEARKLSILSGSFMDPVSGIKKFDFEVPESVSVVKKESIGVESKIFDQPQKTSTLDFISAPSIAEQWSELRGVTVDKSGAINLNEAEFKKYQESLKAQPLILTRAEREKGALISAIGEEKTDEYLKIKKQREEDRLYEESGKLSSLERLKYGFSSFGATEKAATGLFTEIGKYTDLKLIYDPMTLAKRVVFGKDIFQTSSEAQRIAARRESSIALVRQKQSYEGMGFGKSALKYGLESPLTTLIPVGAAFKVGGVAGRYALTAAAKKVGTTTAVGKLALGTAKYGETAVGVGFLGAAGVDIAMRSKTPYEAAGSIATLGLSLPGFMVGYKGTEIIGNVGKIALESPTSGVRRLLSEETAELKFDPWAGQKTPRESAISKGEPRKFKHKDMGKVFKEREAFLDAEAAKAEQMIGIEVGGKTKTTIKPVSTSKIGRQVQIQKQVSQSPQKLILLQIPKSEIKTVQKLSLETLQKQVQVPVLTQVQAQVQVPVLTQKQVQVQKQKQIQAQVQVPVLTQKQAQIPVQIQKQVTLQRQAQIPVQIQKQVTLQKQAQIPVQIQKQVTLQKQAQIPVKIQKQEQIEIKNKLKRKERFDYMYKYRASPIFGGAEKLFDTSKDDLLINVGSSKRTQVRRTKS